jgi:hypothetical protein
MVNKMEIRRERLRDGAKLRVALAAQVMKGKSRACRDARRSACPAREVACSIAASVAPLFRLRKATSAARCPAFSEAKTGC